MKLTALIAGAVVIASAAEAAPAGPSLPKEPSKWVKVGETNDYMLYAGDVEKSSGHAKVWQLQNFKDIVGPDGKTYLRGPPGKEFRSVRYVVEYDCAADRDRTLFFATYSDAMGHGKRRAGGRHTDDWKPLPDSMRADKAKACAGAAIASSSIKHPAWPPYVQEPDPAHDPRANYGRVYFLDTCQLMAHALTQAARLEDRGFTREQVMAAIRASSDHAKPQVESMELNYASTVFVFPLAYRDNSIERMTADCLS